MEIRTGKLPTPAASPALGGDPGQHRSMAGLSRPRSTHIWPRPPPAQSLTSNSILPISGTELFTEFGALYFFPSLLPTSLGKTCQTFLTYRFFSWRPYSSQQRGPPGLKRLIPLFRVIKGGCSRTPGHQKPVFTDSAVPSKKHCLLKLQNISQLLKTQRFLSVALPFLFSLFI